MKTTQSWIRHEIKYRVTHETLRAFKSYTRNILKNDPNSNNQDGYLNYSIYFDSPHHRFLNEKEEGLEIRTKPRLRIYKDIETEKPLAHFFELKHRRGALVLKERTKIDRQVSLGILSRPNMVDVKKNPILSHFAYLSHRYQIQPAVCVLYKRQAFSSPLYPGLRITFDSNISASLNTGLDTPRGKFQMVLPPNETIIEIKYNQTRPNLIGKIVERFELQQLSFSKYVESMQTLLRSYNAIR